MIVGWWVGRVLIGSLGVRWVISFDRRRAAKPAAVADR
jgi:hypothetical protein